MDRAVSTLGPYLHRIFAERPWALLAWPAVVMVAGVLARWLLGKHAQRLAIVPRTAGGLLGIVSAPFLHANLAHLLANLPPFVVMGALVLRLGEQRFAETFVIVAAGSGLLVWAARPPGRAHGGQWGGLRLLRLPAGPGLLPPHHGRSAGGGSRASRHGGILAGLRPARRETSWEAHVFGFIVGLVKVWWLGR